MSTDNQPSPARRRRWRHYETSSGNRPVLDFIRKLPDDDKAAVLAAMSEVRREGARAARHLRGELFEVRADGDRVIYRILFAREGAYGQVLLSLNAFNKKTQKTPPEQIDLAARRLRDWRSRST
jgi:phage-related protein